MASFLRIMGLSWVFILSWFTLWMLMPYLTNVWKLNFVQAASIINVFVGLSAIMHLAMQFLVDAFIGHFWMLLLSAFSSSIGFGFLAMSTPEASTTCSLNGPGCIGPEQKFFFYGGLVLISLGLFGHSVSLGVFAEEQIDESVSKINPRRFCVGNLGNIIFPLAAALAVPSIESWSVRFAIPATCEVVAILLFLTGSCSYKRKQPKGSPLTMVVRVLVASTLKTSTDFPNDSAQLYEIFESSDNLKPHTDTLRWLDNAAIIVPTESLQQQKKNRWGLCRVTEVEETKSILQLIPFFITSIIAGITFSLGNTFFLEQANRMNPKIGSINLPLPVLLLFYEAARLSARELCLRAAYKRGSNSESLSFGIPVSMILSTVCLMLAAHVETQRLNVVSLVDNPYDIVPLSVLWLLPQYVMLGCVTGVYENSFALYLEDKTPPEIGSYMVLFNVGVCGVGTMSSVLLVDIAGKFSRIRGGSSWFQDSINKSRLDNYYWVIAVLCVINLILYFLVSHWSSTDIACVKTTLSDPEVAKNSSKGAKSCA